MSLEIEIIIFKLTKHGKFINIGLVFNNVLELDIFLSKMFPINIIPLKNIKYIDDVYDYPYFMFKDVNSLPKFIREKYFMINDIIFFSLEDNSNMLLENINLFKKNRSFRELFEYLDPSLIFNNISI